MSLQSELLAKVTAVLTKMNLWETNAKKTEELEAMEEVDASSLVRVSVGGVSKKLELQKLIDSSVSTTYNYFNPTGQLTFVDNELTIPNSQWLINAVNYQKLTPTVIEIPFSETGKTRIDLIYANTLNQILKETGFETVGVAIPPNLPFNTVEVTKIVVTDSEIESVIPGIPSDRNKEDKVSGVVAFGTNDYTATVPEVTQLVTGLKILVTFENPNTGASRMNLNALTDEPIVKNYDTPVVAGDLTGTMTLMYSLDKWVVVGSIGGAGAIVQDNHAKVIEFDLLTTFGTPDFAALTAGAISDKLNILSADILPIEIPFVKISKDVTGLYQIYVLEGIGAGNTSAVVASNVKLLVDASNDFTTALNGKQATLNETNFGSFANALNEKTNLVDADLTNLVDSADSNKAKKVSWLNVWNYIKAKADAIYQATLVSGTNIKTLNGNSLLGSGDLVVGGGGAETFSILWSPDGQYGEQNMSFTVDQFKFSNVHSFQNAFATTNSSSSVVENIAPGIVIPYNCVLFKAICRIAMSGTSRDLQIFAQIGESSSAPGFYNENLNRVILINGRINAGVTGYGQQDTTVHDIPILNVNHVIRAMSVFKHMATAKNANVGTVRFQLQYFFRKV